jgi:uncharacterized spore protein YtfJ
MTDDIQRLLDTFADLRDNANVNACFGEALTVGDRTIIPVAKISYGFGMGAEQGPPSDVESLATSTHGPYGGGMKSSPLGVIEVAEGETRIEPVLDEQKVALLGMLVGAWSVFWLAKVLIAIFGRRE